MKIWSRHRTHRLESSGKVVNRDSEQSGRTMVEMLGVLVVVACFSIGSLGGYTWAMNHYKSFRIVGGLQERMILASIRRKAGQTLTYRKQQIEEQLMGYTVSYDPAYTNKTLDITNGKKITVYGLDEQTCSFLKEAKNLINLQSAGNAVVFMNEAPIEEYSMCVNFSGNTLAVIMYPNTPERQYEKRKETCTFQRRHYDSGNSVNDCGICDDGNIIEDKSKFDPDCQTCDTSSWKVSSLPDGTHPVTEGAEAGKCCVKGSFAYHEILCPQKCVVGSNVYVSGATVGSCSICINGALQSDPGSYNNFCQVCEASTGVLTNISGSCDYAGGSKNGICFSGECFELTHDCSNGSFKLQNGNCLSCSDTNRQSASVAQCAQCGDLRKVVDNYCDPICPEGWFQNKNGNCTLCANTASKEATATECAKCANTDFKRSMDSNNKYCTLPGGCPTGYFKGSSDSICRACSDTTGYAAKSEDCNKCKNTSYPRTLTDGLCVLDND